ncbi:MAG TPA: ABC transporter permease [Planctomycetes bacterium]|nr:ABC transporter permease [Fuerstiella sp.]HIK95307.1 ABC transporter permease [Planctomycetota bacterium]
MTTAVAENPINLLGRSIRDFFCGFGGLVVFMLRMLASLRRGLPRRHVLVPILYEIGVRSVPVVLVTGTFIGMVLAVQTYTQFKMMHMESRLGAIITMTLVSELGPVLAATMLAGRVGSAMAAELGTMRVTEQVHAISALGADPVSYLVVPRFVACVALIPMLTAIADAVGILSGWLFSWQVLGINPHQYWMYAVQFVTGWDVMAGLIKSVFFGCSIAIVACQQGFHCGAGAEGVGRAATQAFVFSFIAILGMDFLLTVVLNTTYYLIWPQAVSLAISGAW